MLNVESIIGALPRFDRFCSVSELNEMVQRLEGDSRFDVKTAGYSGQGVPIHHVKFGAGPTKALFVAGPHAMEPIGGLTVMGLLRLLAEGNEDLCGSNIEWHLVPCIDPDGAVLNEGWTQDRFSMERYLHNFYVQPAPLQVDTTFPIRYKRLHFSSPSPGAAILKSIIDAVRPDFYYSLHNAFIGGGTYYLVSDDMGDACWSNLHALLANLDIPVSASALQSAFCAEFAQGVYESSSARKYYDFVEATGILDPAEEMGALGANSIEYVKEVNGNAVCLVIELPYLKHPHDGSSRPTAEWTRQVRLRIDADNKCLTAILLEEWDKLEAALDKSSPFYQKIQAELVACRAVLHEGGAPHWTGDKTKDLMFRPDLAGNMSESDRLTALLWRRFMPLCHAYSFVRLLEASEKSDEIERALERMRIFFAKALAEVGAAVDESAFEVISCSDLAKAQLASGLIVLNSVIDGPATHVRQGEPEGPNKAA